MVLFKSMQKKYGKKLLNVKSNPNKTVKPIKFEVKQENEIQLPKGICKTRSKVNKMMKKIHHFVLIP